MMRLEAWLVALTLIGCGDDAADPEMDAEAPFAWALPEGFPEPLVPADNPMSTAKVTLGRHLFYDPRLGPDGATACATCHRQAHAFADPRPQLAAWPDEGPARGAPSLVNLAYAPRLGWADPRDDGLEGQAARALDAAADRADAVLTEDATYASLFADAWPDDAAPTRDHAAQALAAFERTLISGGAPYDRFVAGDATALSPAAQRGLRLFRSERLECFHCHAGHTLTDAVDHTGAPTVAVAWHNTGLYDEDGAGAYPTADQGLIGVTGDPADMGRFRAPTLRNIAVTAPYMHDGSLATLEDVIEHYSYGGLAGGPLVSEFVPGFIVSDAEMADLLAFFDSLTDADFLADPRFADPWPASSR
ncbi:MAG: di-heme enzyme [Myxococcales bacterium]|nr:di-heme enzyme [Myxococcales bacterium]